MRVSDGCPFHLLDPTLPAAVYGHSSCANEHDRRRTAAIGPASNVLTSDDALPTTRMGAERTHRAANGFSEAP
jgi:hypothetical protein